MSDSFGDGPFGRKDWSYNVLVGLVPDIYQQVDAEVNGGLVQLLESIVPSFDYIYKKVTDFQDLRDPLKCPTDYEFIRPVVIIKVINLGDGTSRVFLSQNADGLAFDGVKIGFTLKDHSGNKFSILELHASDRSLDYDDAPIDPYTGNKTGKNIIVGNIATGVSETIPLVSGIEVLADDEKTMSYSFSGPDDIDITPDGSHMYVANSTSNTVTAIRTSDMKVTASIVVGNAPNMNIILPNGQYMYVLNYNDNTVSVVHIADNSVIATIPVGVSPMVGVASPDNSHVYVLNYNGGAGTVSVIRTSDNTVVATPAAGGNSQNIVMAPDGSHVYVGNNNGDPNGVTIIRTSDNARTVLAGLGNPASSSITPDGAYLYVPDSVGGVVRVLRTSDNVVVATVTVGSMGSSALFAQVSPDGARVYVSNSDNTVSVIRTIDNVVLASPTVGTGPYRLFVTYDSAYVYVPSSFPDNTVLVIRASDNTVVATISTGFGSTPTALAFTGNGAYVYVTEYSNNTVSVIRSSDNTIIHTISSGTTSGIITDPNDFIVTPINNGVNSGPYICTVALPPVTSNLITVSWAEGGDAVVGYFDNTGRYFGQLGVGSAADYATGNITIVPASGGVIDSNSITIDYTTTLAEALYPVTSPLIDGSHTGPYSYTLPLDPVNPYKVTLFWQESSVEKVGSFSSFGTPDPGLNSSSTINFTTGNISFKSASGNPIDAFTLSIWYWPVNAPLVTDSEIRSPNLLVYLGNDFDVAIDQNEPEVYQRSSLYNAYQLWDLKGSERSYSILGKMHGFTVNARPLYRTNGSFPHEYVFPGMLITEIPGADPHGSIVPPNDGVNTVFTITLAFGQIYLDTTQGNNPRFTISWTESSAKKSVLYNKDGFVVTQTGDTSSLVSLSASTNIISVTFNGAHIPDVNSIVVTYTQAAFYTTIAPFTLVMDEVVLDAIPLDTYCADSDFNAEIQAVVVSNASVVTEHDDGSKRWTAIATATGQMHFSFGTEAQWSGVPIENFKRLSNSTYSFEVVQNGSPAGTGNMIWKALRNLPDLVTEKPGVTPGSTIAPAPNGVLLGPFVIHLAYHPIFLWPRGGGDEITLAYTITSNPRSVDIINDNHVVGPDSADIASALVDRTAGTITVTFAMGTAPDTNSLAVTYAPQSDLNIIGIGTDVTIVGQQYFGYTGVRYRVRFTLSDYIDIASVGNWKIIDFNGIISWIESFSLISNSPYVYDIEFISDTIPASGPANIFYSCVEIPTCNYCAASGILITMDADDALNYPSAYLSSGQAALSLQAKFRAILPVHVRISEFIDYTVY